MIIEANRPLNKCDYICDNIFHVDYLLNQYEPEVVAGIVIISGSESLTYSVTKTKDYYDAQIIKRKTVELQKRQGRGGSSAARIGRIRDEKEDKYVREVATMIVNSFMKENNTKCNCIGLIICGPSELKHKVMKEDIFLQYFSNKVMKIMDCEMYDGVIHKLIENSKDVICSYSDNVYGEQFEIIKKLIRDVDDKLVFGINNVAEELENCMLEYLYIDNSFKEKYESVIKNINYQPRVLWCNLEVETGINVIGVRYW